MSAPGAVSSTADGTMITVVGHNTPYPFSKVKDAVLKLSGEFYFKHDTDNLVRVKDQSGKKRYFRKKSKLIYEIAPNKFVHRSFLVKTDDGIFLDKSDPDTVFIDGKPTRRQFTIEVNGVYYLRSNPNIRQCDVTGTTCLVDDMIKLDPTKYTKNSLVAKSAAPFMAENGQYILQSDARQVMNADGEIVYRHRSDLKVPLTQVFYKFRDSTNPQLDRVDTVHMETKLVEKVAIPHNALGMYVHKSHFDAVDKIYNEVILLREAAATKAIKAALKYADDGPDENQAPVVKKIAQPWPGKYAIFNPPDMGAVISRSCKLTGGMNYTCGVEIETAQGLVPNEVASRLKLRIVGDRSIGAGEYVSGILHGDDGIALLKEQCDAIAQYCLVDDKCGIHWHVGGMKGKRGVAEGNFDRHFAQYAISLGTQIEKELFETLPPSRTPTLKHCHSIMRWKDINDDNWRDYLGAFVHSTDPENWTNPWSFSKFTYGEEGRNLSRKLGDFCGGRYKWLNLVHILSKSSIKTCELRIFPGSTNFDKIYNYLLISMAFVWFAENKVNRIVKGDVTLSEMLEAPFKKHPELAERLLSFCAERKKRFNRTNLYPNKIPKAIF